MRSLLDDSLVGVMLLAAVLYALFSFGPRRLRGRMRSGGAAALRALPRFLGLGPLAQRLTAAATDDTGGPCGGCDNCGSEGQAGRASGAAGASESEINIPVQKIGRR